MIAETDDWEHKAITKGETLQVAERSFFFSVVRGWLCWRVSSSQDSKTISALLLPGDQSEIIHQSRKRYGYVESLTDAEIVIFDFTEIRERMSRNNHLQEVFWHEMMLASDRQRHWIANLGRRKTSQRLAHLFCELWERLRKVGCADEFGFDMPVSQIDLANTVGVHTSHVSRSLRELHQTGVVEVTRKRVFILDRDRLFDLAGFDLSYISSK